MRREEVLTGPFDELVGRSPHLTAVISKIKKLVRTQQPGRRVPLVLITGETGTGKGLLARAIHRAGPRADGPFIEINCAAIPDTLLEAEMFGFERGAFTDARQSKPGLFQAAHRGTLFLDEVALLPIGLQAKLLKVLEEKSVRRLGSTRPEPADVAVVAATNEDLPTAVRHGKFRADLYHRLAVVTVSLPPLRARHDDIGELAAHFLARSCGEYGVPLKTLTPGTLAALEAYPWPGNVRELANVMERVALLGEGDTVDEAMLGLPPVTAGRDAGASLRAASLEDALRSRLEEALADTGGNISRTAALLGITRNTVRARMRKYDLTTGSGVETQSRPHPSAGAAGWAVRTYRAHERAGSQRLRDHGERHSQPPVAANRRGRSGSDSRRRVAASHDDRLTRDCNR